MSELPKGWAALPLDSAATLIRGVSYKKNESSNESSDSLLPILRANNIQDGKLNLDDLVYVPADKVKDEQKVKANDIVIAMSSGSKKLVGKSGIATVDFNGGFGTFCGLLRPQKHLDARFIGHFTCSKYYADLVSSLSKGVNINNLKPAHFSEILVPIAPYNEQIRIANKLDSILAKVDKAQAHLEKIPAILKRFRQSVLAAATSGELAGSGLISEDWKNVKLIDVVEAKPRNGKSPKGVDFDTGIKNLTLSAITLGYFVENKYKFVDLDVPADSHLWVKNQDILIQRANSIEYVGVSAIYEGEDDKYIYPDLIMKCRANDRILSKYLYYALSSEPVRKYFRDNATGTTGNMPKINQTVVSAAPISLPSLGEQKCIVGLVEKLFRKADMVEKQYLDARARLDRLTQSILAKAFRGELVPQDPNDEPADKLLERIVAEKEQNKPKKVTRKRITKAKTAEKE